MVKRVRYFFEWLKEESPELSDYEAWTLALEHYKIESFRDAFVVGSGLAPTALEAIGMALGYSKP